MPLWLHIRGQSVIPRWNIRRHADDMVIAELFQTSPDTRMELATPDLFCTTPVASLAQAIDSLQAKERVILSLIYFEALSAAEIAKALNIDILDVQITCDEALAAISEKVSGLRSQSPSTQVETPLRVLDCDA